MTDLLFENETDIVRDSESKAIKSIDNIGLLQYKKQKSKMKELASQSERLNNLENRFNDIEYKLNRILEKLNG